jgi:outer membrane protein assembly factor BamB
MSVPVRTCPVCGTDNRATDSFCPGCGGSLLDVRPHSVSLPEAPPFFSLPAYLLGDAAKRKRRPPVDGAGGGLVSIGLLLTGISILTPIGPIPVWVTWAAGVVLIVAGFWRMRFDRSAFNRAGMVIAVGGAVMLGFVGTRLFDVRSLVGLAPAGNAPIETPVPDWLESSDEAGGAGSGASPETGQSLASVAMFRGDAARTGSNPGPGPTGDPRRRWRFDTRGEVYSTPAIVDGVVYVGTKQGYLLALHEVTGEELWRFDTGGGIIRSSPAVDGGAIYLASGYNLFALDAMRREERWRAEINFAGPSSPVVVGGFVYLCSEEGTIYSFEAATGHKRWEYQAEGLVFSSPAVGEGGALFFGSDTGDLYALEAESGRLLWRFATEGGVYATPVVVGDTVYVSSKSGIIRAVDVASGQQRWEFNAGGDASPAVVDGVVYVGGDDGGLYALDAATGAQRWLSVTGSPIRSSPAVAGDTVYVGSGKALYAIDLATGDQRWRYPTADAVETSPVVVNGVVFVGARDGYLYAIAGSGFRAGTPVASG